MSIRRRSMCWSRPTRPRSGRATAPRWWRRRGPIRPFANGSSPMRPPRSPRSASPAARASTWWRSRIRRTSTTWSSAPCAPATPGRCSGCRRCGTNRRRTAPAPSSIRAASLPSSASSCRSRPHPGLGFDRRGPLSRRADAAGRHRGLERGRARRPRHARFDDRRRAGAQAGSGGSRMNGAQDLGGMMGFGRIDREADEPWFHADWERRALGLTLAMGATGQWTIDMSRAARESLHPADYLSSSYYEIWTKGLEKLVLRQGLVTQDELAAGHALGPPKPVARVLKAEAVPAALAKASPCDRPAQTPARFAAGDRVMTKVMHPAGHTRLPRYARGKRGFVERVHGAHVFPDSSAAGQGENPQWLYTVRFSGPELWGEEADPNLVVSIDAWESYLEPA